MPSLPSIPILYDRYGDFDLLVDSRRLRDPEKTLFFALPGQRTHGNKFVRQLYRKGVRHFVVHTLRRGPQVQGELDKQGKYPEATFLLTDDPLRLLQQLAAHHRRQFDIPVLAITGSNGKTIVKDWLAQLLQPYLKVCASPRSYNSRIGVPLSVWRLRPEHEIAIFEAGISEAGEMAALAEIIRPTCGLFTMLGSAHAAGFTDELTKHREKMSLFRGAKWVVVPADDTTSVGLLRKLDVEPITHLGIKGRWLEVEEVSLELPFPELPAIYLENAYAAATAAYALGLGKEQIAASLPDLHVLDNRLEQRAGLHGGPVINDSYSNDLTALAAALDFAEARANSGKLCLILGTIQPRSSNSPSTRVSAPEDTLLPLLHPRLTRLLTIGETNAGLSRSIAGARHFSHPEALLAELGNIPFSPGEVILIKGASEERLHRVADALSRQQHRTLLRIDLAALRHNFNVYRSGTSAKMIVMVKASAYGGGAPPVAHALAEAGADYLAVAYPDEGSHLRQHGLQLPIMVLNAAGHDFDRMLSNRLEPVIHRLEDLRRAREAGLKVHLELDTGMARLGFRPAELKALLTELRSGDYARTIASVFTHLAASEDGAHDDFTRQQINTFDAAYERIAEALGASPSRHLLNSNGISRFPGHAYEYVRLGIGLYGIGDAAKAAALRPVLSFSTRVTAVFELKAGQSIGYGRRGKMAHDGRVAVLSVGYADGLPRLAGEGRFSVRLPGGLAPVIGSVCMDMTMVDVSQLPGVKVDDEAMLFGADHPIEELAEAAMTIPYEILTGIGPRVQRVYTAE